MINLTEEQKFKYFLLLTGTPPTSFRELKNLCEQYNIPLQEGYDIVTELIKLDLLETKGNSGAPNYSIKRKFLPNEPNYHFEILKHLEDTYLKNRPKDLLPLLQSFQDNFWQTNSEIQVMLSKLSDEKYILIGGYTVNNLGRTGGYRSLGTFSGGLWWAAQFTLKNAEIRGEILTEGLKHLRSLELKEPIPTIHVTDNSTKQIFNAPVTGSNINQSKDSTVNNRITKETEKPYGFWHTTTWKTVLATIATISALITIWYFLNENAKHNNIEQKHTEQRDTSNKGTQSLNSDSLGHH